jgi:hypothetical protein
VDWILEKKYLIDITKRDLRTGIILANVERGKAKEVAKMILERHKSNAISSSTRINDQNNVLTEIIYNTSSELYNILEQVKNIPYVSSATWTELVEVVGNNDAPILAALSPPITFTNTLLFLRPSIFHNKISLLPWPKV